MSQVKMLCFYNQVNDIMIAHASSPQDVYPVSGLAPFRLDGLRFACRVAVILFRLSTENTNGISIRRLLLRYIRHFLVPSCSDA